MNVHSTGILDKYGLMTVVRNPVYAIVDDLLDRKKKMLGGFWGDLRDALKKLELHSDESEVVARLATRAVDETLLHLRRFMDQHTVLAHADGPPPDQSAFERSGISRQFPGR